MKVKKKPASRVAATILKKMDERDPNDNLNALAVRVKTFRGTLDKMMYHHPRAFNTSQLLFRICADRGWTMEEILGDTEITHNRDKELKYWKDRAFEAEKELKEVGKAYKTLAGEMFKIK